MTPVADQPSFTGPNGSGLIRADRQAVTSPVSIQRVQRARGIESDSVDREVADRQRGISGLGALATAKPPRGGA
jgi:hypothetical protein